MVRKLLRKMVHFPQCGPPEFPADLQGHMELREEETSRRTG